MKYDFVNEKDKKVALEKFWTVYDHEGWSIWKLEYQKAEGECEALYKTRNLLTGFL